MNRSGSRFWVLRCWVVVLGSGFMCPGATAQTHRDDRILSCDGPLGPTMTPDTLADAFGKANVTLENIAVGEGFFEKGTVLFSESPEDRLLILWRNEQVQQGPRMAQTGSRTSRWRTSSGVLVGLDLRALERINRRPFRLSGFRWDNGGGVLSWSGGGLDRQLHQSCELGATLAPTQDAVGAYAPGAERLVRQVSGERLFSSGHPAMQALNPMVTVLYQVYVGQKR